MHVTGRSTERKLYRQICRLCLDEPMISRANAPRSRWGGACDGWTLLKAADLHVAEERLAGGAREVLHVHRATRQMYYVLNGTAEVEVGEARHALAAGEAAVISPQVVHQLRSAGDKPLELLVISSRPPRQNRRELE